MTKEEIKFQCLEVALRNQPNEKKDVKMVVADAQKIYDWIILGSKSVIKKNG